MMVMAMNEDTGRAKMNVEPRVSAESGSVTPQERVSSRLLQASELRHAGKSDEATAELAKALADARETPYEIEFQTRIQLAMTLADVYQSTGENQKACEMLAQELAFAEKITQIMQATGTPSQKRAATSGTLQVRDRARQLALIGQEAPEISVKEWINGGPATLSDLRGQVVLLEFWATWCKPCQEMFPNLTKLYEKEAARGLEIIGLTRHYLAYRGTAESMSDELRLMRRMITENEVTFLVGVAEDERLQGIYGANGLPTVALIDRRSIVRYAGPGADDSLFNGVLQRCLEESA
jgi:thiol-disulfide isomerase/thioredoxin